MVRSEYGIVGVSVQVDVPGTTGVFYRDIENVEGFGPLGVTPDEATHAYVSPDVLKSATEGTRGLTAGLKELGVRNIPAEEALGGRELVEIPLVPGHARPVRLST